MATGNISSEKIDLLIYGPGRPILQNGFSDQFVLHAAETKHDLERLAAVAEKVRGIAVTYHTVHADKSALALFPKLEIVASPSASATTTSIPPMPANTISSSPTRLTC